MCYSLKQAERVAVDLEAPGHVAAVLVALERVAAHEERQHCVDVAVQLRLPPRLLVRRVLLQLRVVDVKVTGVIEPATM